MYLEIIQETKIMKYAERLFSIKTLNFNCSNLKIKEIILLIWNNINVQ